MCGAPVTSGLPANRASAVASETTNRSDCAMACALKETSRGVWDRVSPIRDLNQSRSASTRLTNATGVSQICEARRVRSSNASSGGESRTLYARSACSRSASLEGRGAAFTRQSVKLCLADLYGKSPSFTTKLWRAGCKYPRDNGEPHRGRAEIGPPLRKWSGAPAVCPRAHSRMCEGTYGIGMEAKFLLT